jgi:hypothetical protein
MTTFNAYPAEDRAKPGIASAWLRHSRPCYGGESLVLAQFIEVAVSDGPTRGIEPGRYCGSSLRSSYPLCSSETTSPRVRSRPSGLSPRGPEGVTGLCAPDGRAGPSGRTAASESWQLLSWPPGSVGVHCVGVGQGAEGT